MKNALTFDIEDYFQVSAFDDHVEKDQWEHMPSRVEANTTKVLDLLSEAECQATFFVLGWVAKTHPRLIHEIANRGHEVACHSLEHRRVYQMTPEEFAADTRAAKQVLEDAGGVAVRGYRAPSFSINMRSLWAFEILAELGFQYDSSIYPVKHPNYGIPEFSRFPFFVRTAAGDVMEFPMSTVEITRLRAPVAGGAYFRFLPYSYTRWSIRYLNEFENRSACVYLHPWEIDPGQPRMDVSFSARLRHYIGLRKVEGKVRHLLSDFEFRSIGSLIEEIKRRDPLPPTVDLSRMSHDQAQAVTR
jgi:polysaccharide deacetylase family protein (PEP-CTERM system associated)